VAVARYGLVAVALAAVREGLVLDDRLPYLKRSHRLCGAPPIRQGEVNAVEWERNGRRL